MRFTVNLATRPFVNHLPHFLLLALLAVGAVGLSAWNTTRFLSSRSEARAVSAQLDELDRREAALREREVELRERIAATDMETLWEDVLLADSVLAEKAVSWAELLERLEDLLPWKAALRSVSTNTSPSGVSLTMQVQALDQERYLQFIETLEASPCFAAAYPTRETRLEDGQFTVSLTADYDPTCSVETVPARTRETVPERASSAAPAEGGARG